MSIKAVIPSNLSLSLSLFKYHKIAELSALPGRHQLTQRSLCINNRPHRGRQFCAGRKSVHPRSITTTTVTCTDYTGCVILCNAASKNQQTNTQSHLTDMESEFEHRLNWTGGDMNSPKCILINFVKAFSYHRMRIAKYMYRP